MSRLLYDGRTGFSRIGHGSVKEPTDQIVLVFFEGEPEPWLVDCPEGIANLRIAYKDWYEAENLDFLILNQALPSWVVVVESMPQLESGKLVEDATTDSGFGPFYSADAALEFENSLQNEPGFLGATAVPLQKPYQN